MFMYSERLLARFLLDILKSLVGLDILLGTLIHVGKGIRQSIFGQSKGTQQHARADKGRLKGYILHPSVVKINCSLNHFVYYVNYEQTFFSTVGEYEWRFG